MVLSNLESIVALVEMVVVILFYLFGVALAGHSSDQLFLITLLDKWFVVSIDLIL